MNFLLRILSLQWVITPIFGMSNWLINTLRMYPVIMHIWNPSVWKAEQGLSQNQGQPGLHSVKQPQNKRLRHRILKPIAYPQ